MLLYYVMCVMGKIVSYVLFLQLSHNVQCIAMCFVAMVYTELVSWENLIKYLLNGSTIPTFKVLYNQCDERFNVHVVS